MKQFLINIIILCCFSTLAAKDRLEIWGGYSTGSAIGNVPEVTAPTMDNYTRLYFSDPHRQHQALSLGVNVRILGNLSIGMSWTGLNSCSFDASVKNADGVIVTSKYNTNTVLFNLKYQWAKFSVFRLYSRGGIGSVFISAPHRSGNSYFEQNPGAFSWEDGNEACKRIAWQLSPLGVEIRPVSFIGIFAEGGFGRQGNLVAGIKFFCL